MKHLSLGSGGLVIGKADISGLEAQGWESQEPNSITASFLAKFPLMWFQEVSN